MNWLRDRLRAWLGITALENLRPYGDELKETRKLQAELRAMLQEVKEVREMLHDPKRIPIKTRTTQQYRALMEVE